MNITNNVTWGGSPGRNVCGETGDVSGKMDKIASPVAGNLVSMNASGNAVNSGIALDDNTVSGSTLWSSEKITNAVLDGGTF